MLTNSIPKFGLFMSLLCFIGCRELTDSSKDTKPTQFSIGRPTDTLTFRYDRNLKWVYARFLNAPYVEAGFLNFSILVLSNHLTQKNDSIFLAEPITSPTHHFFGDLSSGYIYNSSFEYNDDEPDCVYEIEIRTGKVRKLYAEVDFTEYGERFGRSLINQFARNDTFFLGFQYPYINGENTSGLGVWDVPHMGIGYSVGDSIKFTKAFGYQKPKLAEEYIWKHPRLSYVPAKNEILFSYYWSPLVLVYDFKGNLKQKIKIDIEGFDKSKFYGNSYQSGCFGSGEWDAYMRDSVLHFSQVGFLEKEQLYYRTISFASGDPRGNSAIVLFNAEGEIKKMISGFDDSFGFINLIQENIYSFNKAFDSLDFRVVKYLKYDYPQGW